MANVFGFYSDFVTLDTDQTIEGEKTFSSPPLTTVAPSSANMLCNKNYVDSSISATGANYVTLNTTQLTISGQKTFTNTSNQYAGTGLYLTGIVRLTQPQTVAGIKTFQDAPICSVVPTTANMLCNKTYVDGLAGKVNLTADNTSGTYYIPFSKTNAASNNSLFIDDTTGPLVYDPSTSQLSAASFCTGPIPASAGTNAGKFIQNIGSSATVIQNEATSGSFFINLRDASNVLSTRFTINSTSAVFYSAPQCSVVPTTGDMLCNKTYVDSAVTGGGTYVTTNTVQTITAQKTFAAIQATNKLSFISATSGNRSIDNTFYNLHDNAAAASGTYRGRMYADPANVFLEIAGAAFNYIVTIGGVNVFQITPTAATFSSAPLCSVVPTTGNMLCNKTYVDNAVSGVSGSYVTTNTVQTITNIKTFTNDVIHTWRIFGRNDGNSFTTKSTSFETLNLWPLGSVFDITGPTTQPVSLTDVTDDVSIELTKGVWMLSGFITLNKGNGTYTTGTRLSALWNVGIFGLTLYPNAAGAIVSIPSTSTVSQHLISLGSVTVVCTTQGNKQTMTRNINMTVGSTTSWSISFSGVKVA